MHSNELTWTIGKKDFRESDIIFMIESTNRQIKSLNMGSFLKFFTIHFIDVIISPFLALLIMLFSCQYTLASNIRFMGGSWIFWLQRLLSLTSSLCISVFVYAYIKCDSHNLNIADILPLLNQLMIRVLIISSKYGYFSRESLSLYSSKKLTEKITGSSQIL